MKAYKNAIEAKKDVKKCVNQLENFEVIENTEGKYRITTDVYGFNSKRI